MPTEYSLTDLAKIADVTPRTIRYYIEQGLLPSPTQVGPNARYTEAHLDRLRLIKKLQAAHLPLADIRGQLRGLGEDEIATMLASVAAEQTPRSAIDYVRRVLREPPIDDQATYYSRPASASMPAPASMPAAPSAALAAPARAPEPSVEPDRSQWERISLHPDVELHIRRPLGRIKNKRVDRLISIARQLLEEE